VPWFTSSQGSPLKSCAIQLFGALARAGFSIGGRPPFGFRRWLVHVDGTPKRQLVDGEYVKQAGHHVAWLPGPDEEIALIRRILGMLESMPASRVAATLTAEGVSPPDASRYRTDRGAACDIAPAGYGTNPRSPISRATLCSRRW
jgi:hypothetical protein